MTRTRVIWIGVTALLAVLVVWIASHTYWADTQIPMPPKGEALTNPFYAAENFVRALGARATRDRVFATPPGDAVVVLSGWHWSVVRTRREALERWVESGGRLVVDRELATSGDDFEQWSGIKHKYWGADGRRPSRFGSDGCRTFDESFGDTSQTATPTEFSICGVWFSTSLLSDKPTTWALRDESGLQAVRVAVGRGSVTVINATPFRYQNLFDGDHGRLLAAATELRRGDSVHFLSEGDSPTLLALVWRSGAPVVVFSLLAVALLMWRGAVRLGPLAMPAAAERRSLAEQIRGTGEFALRHGDGEALHAASVRALEEAARRRVSGYTGLSAKDRGAALERLSGINATDILSAAYDPRSHSPQQLRTAIAVLEAARRHMLLRLKRS
jgi:hypothetical protein